MEGCRQVIRPTVFTGQENNIIIYKSETKQDWFELSNEHEIQQNKNPAPKYLRKHDKTSFKEVAAV